MKSVYLSSVANSDSLEDELEKQFCQVLASIKSLDDNHTIPISEKKRCYGSKSKWSSTT